MLRIGFWFSMLFLTCAMATSAQDTRLEDRLKATFIYNFLQFVDWPPRAFSDNPQFTVCVLGPGFEDLMKETVRGETIGGRGITVKPIAPGDPGHECHVIYIHAPLGSSGADMLKALRNSPVLTVGEDREFMENGGIIRFIKTENHIRFEINPAAAERASLILSSRLLRLADIVRDPPRRVP